MLSNPYLFPTAGVNSMLANPFAQQVAQLQKASLGLTQIEGFPPVQDFVDDANTKWSLVKSASDSTVDIPDPTKLKALCHVQSVDAQPAQADDLIKVEGLNG